MRLHGYSLRGATRSILHAPPSIGLGQDLASTYPIGYLLNGVGLHRRLMYAGRYVAIEADPYVRNDLGKLEVPSIHFLSGDVPWQYFRGPRLSMQVYAFGFFLLS